MYRLTHFRQINTKVVPLLKQHSECVINKLNEHQEQLQSRYEKQLAIFEEFKLERENENPLCKVLREKTKEVKKQQIRCKILEHELETRAKQISLKTAIRKKRFNNTIIQLAAAVRNHHLDQSLTEEIKKYQDINRNLCEKYKKQLEKRQGMFALTLLSYSIFSTMSLLLIILPIEIIHLIKLGDET